MRVGAPGRERGSLRGTEVTVGRPETLLVTPTVDEHGLVNVPASLFLFGFEGTMRWALTTLFEDPIVSRARQGIVAASRSDGVFHMWLHPNNLGRPADVRRVESILSSLDQRRDVLEIATMADVAASTEHSLETVHASAPSLGVP